MMQNCLLFFIMDLSCSGKAHLLVNRPVIYVLKKYWL